MAANTSTSRENQSPSPCPTKKNYSTGRRAGAGFLNLAFGAGEFFLMNNRKAALGFLIANAAGYGAAIGLFVAESKLTWEDNRDIIGVPGTIGFCVAGATLLGTGIAGFILPFRDHALPEHGCRRRILPGSNLLLLPLSPRTAAALAVPDACEDVAVLFHGPDPGRVDNPPPGGGLTYIRFNNLDFNSVDVYAGPSRSGTPLASLAAMSQSEAIQWTSGEHGFYLTYNLNIVGVDVSPYTCTYAYIYKRVDRNKTTEINI